MYYCNNELNHHIRCWILIAIIGLKIFFLLVRKRGDSSKKHQYYETFRLNFIRSVHERKCKNALFCTKKERQDKYNNCYTEIRLSCMIPKQISMESYWNVIALSWRQLWITKCRFEILVINFVSILSYFITLMR
jgi:hypothetical protein